MLPLLIGLMACTSGPVVLSAELHSDNPHIAIVRVAVDEDAIVRVAYGEDGDLGLSTPELAVVAGEEVEIPVLGLRPDRTYSLAAVVDGARPWTSHPWIIHTPPLPMDWPRCQVQSSAPAGTFGPEEVVCTDFYVAAEEEVRFGCVDREGEVVFQMRPPAGKDIMATTPLRDGDFAATSFSVDQLSVFDERGGFLTEYRSVWLRGRTRFEHGWIDGHDVVQLNTGPWAGALAFITYTEDVWNEEVLFGGGVVVVEPTTGEVLWDWTSHGELGDGVPIDPKLEYGRRGLVSDANDWQHTNGLVHGLDDDGGQFMWLSLRHQEWIIKVDVETDAVVWRLGLDGDFALVDDLDDPGSVLPSQSLWFYQQHSPELRWHGAGRARFLVFDNGNVRVEDGQVSTAASYSRLAEFEIDEDTMRAELVWSFGPSDPQDPRHFYSGGMGDVLMLPGGERVLYSTGVYTEPPHVAELSYPGSETLWRLDCEPVLGMYRVFFFPSLYERSWWYQVER